MSILDDVKAALRKIEEAKRVVICHPDDAVGIRAELEKHPMGHMFEVAESAALLEPGAIYIVPKVLPFKEMEIRL